MPAERLKVLAVAIIAALPSGFPARVLAQQVPDSAFRPPIQRPAYQMGTGPILLVDEAHSNFHTTSGRYYAFAELLRRDGYIVRSSEDSLTADVLRGVAVLVSANARRPFAPSEVSAIRDWLYGGGALLLIVDHPPFVEASVELAAAVGVRLHDRGVGDPDIPTGRLIYRRSDGTLVDHVVTAGIDSVATFTGSSLELGDSGQPILVLGPRVLAFTEQGERDPTPLKGHAQGGVLEFGVGRVAVFGEAAMFSAQLTGPSRTPMGMNDPIARQNAQFLLNVVHWLTKRS